MDGNKDEAQRCINIALEAAKSGNLQRAEKFLRKADSLYPSQRAKGKTERKINDIHDENTIKANILLKLKPFKLCSNRFACSVER